MGWYIWPENDPLGEPPCTFCGKPIKVGTKFYFEGPTKYSHAGCAWEDAEKNRIPHSRNETT